MSESSSKLKSGAERSADYYRRKRAQGLRRVRLWVLNTRLPEVVAEYRRQAKAIAAGDPAGHEVVAWLDQVRDWPRD